MKIGFLITARLKSSRLPLKLLKELGNRTLIEHVIDRIKELDALDTIVMCTSTNKQDKALVDISIKNNIYYFNGNEEDVLQRLLDAGKLFDLDYFIGITGENPLFSIEYTNEIIQLVKENKYDFVGVKGLPIGCATYGMNIKALEVICKVKEVIDTEIWGYLINRPEIFNNKFIEVAKEYQWPELRITIDYPEDFEFVKTIFQNLTYEQRLSLKEVFEFLRANPSITDIHKHRTQLDLPEEIKKQIHDFYTSKQEEVIALKNNIYHS